MNVAFVHYIIEVIRGTITPSDLNYLQSHVVYNTFKNDEGFMTICDDMLDKKLNYDITKNYYEKIPFYKFKLKKQYEIAIKELSDSFQESFNNYETVRKLSDYSTEDFIITY